MDNSNAKDHKQIGIEQELFFSSDYAPGAPFWLPKGMTIFKELEKYIRKLTGEAGYDEISTPIMIKSELFKESGHWTKFGEHNMYNLALWEDEEIKEIQEIVNKTVVQPAVEEEILKSGKYYALLINFHGQELIIGISNPVKRTAGLVFNMELPVNYTLKPMNCPEATIVYRFRPRSYRELPLRLMEIGRLHRREKSGEVNGLLRVRQLTMDDAHLFVAEDQIFDEVGNILDTMVEFYSKFGFELDFRLATKPELYAGTDENWARAEKDLEDALKKKKLKYTLKPQDGAFYGPKIDLHIKDSLGREWQLGTVQLDFHMPEAFDLKYIDNKGQGVRPVMIHRAILGSFERFVGILTEHYQGVFPLWLSPIQVAVIPVKETHVEEVEKIVKKLNDEGIRAEMGNKFENLSSAIKEYTLQKVPYLAIIGDREVENKTVSVRGRAGKDLGTISLSDFVKRAKEEIDKKE